MIRMALAFSNVILEGKTQQSNVSKSLKKNDLKFYIQPSNQCEGRKGTLLDIQISKKFTPIQNFSRKSWRMSFTVVKESLGKGKMGDIGNRKSSRGEKERKLPGRL